MQTRRRHTDIALDDLDRAIVNRLQDELPLASEPFAGIASEVGCATPELLLRIERLLSTGALTRFGPFYDAAAMGGAYCLCAMSVPQVCFDEIAEIVNGFDEVAHNYARDHVFNMWFVLATEAIDDIATTARAIESATGLPVLLFPKEQEYFIGFKVAA